MNPRGDPRYRMLQVFLAPNADGVATFECYVEMEHHYVVCTCPGFRVRQQCRHAGFVAQRLADHQGYSAWLLGGGQLTQEIMADPEAFRRWLLDNAKVEILDAEGNPLQAPGV